ncbi:hypothetical protein EF405_20010 [Cyclobacteriaceae bacterium YHN15]|nr:hypothetical protein EF405_20010 [Cyclobacteriaceae bacterium YHN15]
MVLDIHRTRKRRGNLNRYAASGEAGQRSSQETEGVETKRLRDKETESSFTSLRGATLKVYGK